MGSLHVLSHLSREDVKIGLRLLFERCFNCVPNNVNFHILVAVSFCWSLIGPDITAVYAILYFDLHSRLPKWRHGLRMSFFLLFFLVSWISAILCPTLAQGEFGKFPFHLLCIL